MSPDPTETAALRLRPRCLPSALVALVAACSSAPPAVEAASPAARDRAAARGLSWLAGYLGDAERAAALGWDAVQIFLEAADTSADPALRALGREQARRHARRLTAALLAAPPPLASGDVLDLLALTVDAQPLGLDPEPLRARAREAYRTLADPDDVLGPGPLTKEAIASATDADALALLLDVYCVERARILGLWPGGNLRLADVLAILRSRRLPARLDDRGPGRDRFRDRVYLLAHVAYVLNDYGRLRLRREDAPWVVDDLERAFPQALASRDVEIVAEIVDIFRALDPGGATHPLVREGTRFLLETHNADGSWGAGGRDPYEIVHATWCATTALRVHRFLSGTAWERHVREALAAGGR